MAEAKSISTRSRSKSPEDIIQQMNRIDRLQRKSGEDVFSPRMRRMRTTALQYITNMQNSPAMMRAYRAAGGRPIDQTDLSSFITTFGRGREVQVPRSQYMRRRNNRG